MSGRFSVASSNAVHFWRVLAAFRVGARLEPTRNLEHLCFREDFGEALRRTSSMRQNFEIAPNRPKSPGILKSELAVSIDADRNSLRDQLTKAP